VIGDVPYFFKRCAVTHELYDLVVEIRPSETSMGFAEHISRMPIILFFISETDLDDRASLA